MNKEEEEKNEALKDIEYYSNLVNAWYNTKLEKDKSILTISAGGLGLLVTLISTLGVNNRTELILFIIDIFCFMVSIVSMISIFERNATRLEKELNEKSNSDMVLKFLDKVGSISFSLAIAFTFIIGISISCYSLNKNEEYQMCKDKQNISTSVPTKKPLNKSFEKVHLIRPTKTEKTETTTDQPSKKSPVTEPQSTTND